MRHSTAKFLTALLLLAASDAAFAHPGHNFSGFVAGLMHPFSGFDHLLAMVAVGLWAAQGRTRKVWLLPASFITMLAVGAGIATQWQTLPLVETGIAVSVLALGMPVALSLQLPVLPSVAITALFGLLHGYAHGLELPASAEPVEFTLGILFATAALHFFGILSGIAMRNRFAVLEKSMGVFISTCGLWLLVTG